MARLTELMAAAGFKTSAALASAAGVSRQSVDRWLAGSWPGGEHIVALCRALQTDPVYLLEGEPVRPTGSQTVDPVAIAKVTIARQLQRVVEEALGGMTADATAPRGASDHEEAVRATGTANRDEAAHDQPPPRKRRAGGAG